MARTSTLGSVEWRGDPANPKPTDHWRTRVTIKGKRQWMRLPGLTHSQEAKARKAARQLALLAAAGKLEAPTPSRAAPSPSDPTAETFKVWLDRWLLSRKKRGKKSNQSDTSKVAHWIASRLGERPVAAITRDEIEAWVEWIDGEVQNDALSWKTAKNAWGLLSIAMADASRGKIKSLRCRTDNPCDGVAPPDTGESKSKVYLYPDELLTLLRCVEIPLAIRRAYAVTAYLYPRAGEVEALHWEDIDLTHSTVHVHRAVDPETGEIRGTKGKAARNFDLEPELVPLLRAMRDERPKDAMVFEPWPLHKDRAGQFRKYLKTAGVTRATLFASDKTRKNITFHDLRATGTTWAAIRGDDALRIMHRAGHKDLTTTQGYIREAENVSRDFGTVFPPLPRELLHSSPDSSPGPLAPPESGPASPPSTPQSPVNSASGQVSEGLVGVRIPYPEPHNAAILKNNQDSPQSVGTNLGTNSDPDAALRAALSAAVGAGDLGLAEQLLRLLRSREPSPVVSLDARRRHG